MQGLGYQKSVAKTIQKRSLKAKSNLTTFMSYAVHLTKLAITRDKDLMDLRVEYLKKKKK
jgi:hypothetical protein